MRAKELAHGVGVNDADYVVRKYKTIGYADGKQERKLIWFCPYYRAWLGMLERCYSTKYHEQRPTYVGCSVSDEWLTFSNFRAWMEAQDWEGLQLDKDLLIEGNKVYGPETCVFVTPMVNSFTTDSGASRGEWLIGVSWHKETSKFQARCNNPFTKTSEHLGRFPTEQEGHQAWLKRKLELAKELAAMQTDARVAAALVNRYSNYQVNK